MSILITDKVNRSCLLVHCTLVQQHAEAASACNQLWTDALQTSAGSSGYISKITEHASFVCSLCKPLLDLEIRPADRKPLHLQGQLCHLLPLQALRKENVKVMLINPGPIATAMTEVSTLLLPGVTCSRLFILYC